MNTISSATATDEEISVYLDNAPVGFTVSVPVSEQRLSICNACEEKRNVFGLDQCQVCNCLIKLKVKLTYTKCPIDKWQKNA